MNSSGKIRLACCCAALALATNLRADDLPNPEMGDFLVAGTYERTPAATEGVSSVGTFDASYPSLTFRVAFGTDFDSFAPGLLLLFR